MSVTIRLAKTGRKNAPAFKIVVANTRDKRNGKFLDVLGFYNPSHNPVTQNLDETKYNDWVNKGAIVSKAVQQIKEGTYKYVKYNPKAKAEAEAAAAASENQENSSSSEESEPSEE